MSENYQIQKLTKTEINGRMSRFREKMDLRCPDWEAALIFTHIHMYYFTGTMQNGMLYIPRNATASLWVHQSYERACMESNFEPIYPMGSYRDAREAIGCITKSIHIEANLWIDESPVIAKGFDQPIEENMVFAVEPKRGIEGIGMVGIENTFVCKNSGGISITGEHPGLLCVR